MAKCKRRGFTLLELILALALSVLVMAIIVGLVGMYSSNFTTRGEDIRRVALARAILNMIADDLRATVTKQEYDTKVLEQMLMGQGGGGAAGGAGLPGGLGGGGQTGGGMSGGGGGGGGPTGGQNNGGGNNQGGNNQGGGGQGGGGNNALPGGGGGGAQAGGGSNNQRGGGGGGGQPGLLSAQGQGNRGSGGQMFGGSTGQSGQASGPSQAGQTGQTGQTDDAANAEGTTATSTALPLGVYGSATNLTIDISRIPRIDEYSAQQNTLLNGTLSDLPGDIKSVSYFVQLPTTMGVTDSMNEVSTTQTSTGGVAGLVRRALDRAVMDNAEEMGQSDQLNRTGELVAPEVLALEFSYFDGTQWLTTWDSSTQGLPWLVDINLAMQSKSGEKNGAVPPGISLTTMTYEERQRYGIEIYNLTVTIPGAQLQSTGTADASGGTGTDSGMSSVGL